MQRYTEIMKLTLTFGRISYHFRPKIYIFHFHYYDYSPFCKKVTSFVRTTYQKNGYICTEITFIFYLTNIKQ